MKLILILLNSIAFSFCVQPLKITEEKRPVYFSKTSSCILQNYAVSYNLDSMKLPIDSVKKDSINKVVKESVDKIVNPMIY
jgi:hypothetical protein